MKISYSALRCPHCGSSSINIVNDDVFLCDYCHQKFNFSLENIDFQNENKIFIEELKDRFIKEIEIIKNEKRIDKAMLIYYKKRANPRFLSTFSLCSLIISALASYSTFFLENLNVFWYCLTIFGLSVFSFIFSKIRIKLRQKKYQANISYCAKKIAAQDEKISLYERLVSRLTK